MIEREHINVIKQSNEKRLFHTPKDQHRCAIKTHDTGCANGSISTKKTRKNTRNDPSVTLPYAKQAMPPQATAKVWATTKYII